MAHFVVIGLGSIGRRHVTNLAALQPDARFTIVRHRGESDEFCERFGARVVGDLSEVIDGDIDLAVLSTPSADHVQALPALIERACPLLVEKPIVTDVADATAIAALLRRADPALRVAGFNLRHLPSIRRMKDCIDAGDLGRIVRASFVAGQWLPDWRPGTDYRSGYSADARRGGGVELDLCHEIDLARWFFGDLQVDHAAGGKFSSLDLQSNDTATAILSPTGGPSPLITVSLDYVSRCRVRRYEIVGDGGTLSWNIDGELSMATSDGCRSLTVGEDGFDVGGSYVEMMRAVLIAAETGAHDQIQSLDDGLASTVLAVGVRDEGRRA
jgi:predicted dehydrogenase